MKNLLGMFEVERMHAVMNHLNVTQLAGACNAENATLRIRLELDESDGLTHVLLIIQHNNYDNKKVSGYIALHNSPDRICRYAWKLFDLWKEDYKVVASVNK